MPRGSARFRSKADVRFCTWEAKHTYLFDDIVPNGASGLRGLDGRDGVEPRLEGEAIFA